MHFSKISFASGKVVLPMLLLGDEIETVEELYVLVFIFLNNSII